MIWLAAPEYRDVCAQAQLQREVVLKVVRAEALSEGKRPAADLDRRACRPAELRSGAPRDGDGLGDSRCLCRRRLRSAIRGRRGCDRERQSDEA